MARRPALAFFMLCGGLLACGCAATPAEPPAVPSVDVRESTSARAPNASSSSACADRSLGATWTTERLWREKTVAKASCQVAPLEASSELVATSTVLERSDTQIMRMSVRMTGDRDGGTPAPAGPNPAGRTYSVQQAPSGLEVRDASGAPVPDEEARRVRAIVLTHLGWPGAEIASHTPAPGAEIDSLATAVQTLAGVSLRGEPAREVTASVHFSGRRSQAWGAALAFDVKLHARSLDAGMCHRWIVEADLTGPLLLRAEDGSFVSLSLRGPRRDTEAVCPDVVAQGASSGPRTCNEGEATLDVTERCSQSLSQ